MDTKSIRIAEEDAGTREWTERVGRFFRACGLIELLTIEFIARMAPPDRVRSLRKKFLSQRLTWLVGNIKERSLSGEEAADEIIETLENIRQLSIFRNVLTNGALGLSESGGGEGGTTSITGVLNFRPEDGESESELISLEEIGQRTEEAETLAGDLLALLNRTEFAEITVEE